MSQDLRDLFKKSDLKSSQKMKTGHEGRFIKKLEKELPDSKTPSDFFWKIAVSVALIIGVGAYFLTQNRMDPSGIKVSDAENNGAETRTLSLGDLSPDLKKVEDYYVSTINFELSKLQLTEENKDLVDGFLEQLSELNEEYRRLNIELNETGPNDQTINALIRNLQLRLRLLHQLKDKLSELKSSENEQDNII